jgi:hypothetical protein
MKDKYSIVSGFCKAIKNWKWILAAWIIALLITAAFVLPLRAAVNNILGSSMITEKLKDGINLDVFANSGFPLKVITGYFGSALPLFLFIGFLFNVFLSAGFFGAMSGKPDTQAAKGFFASASSNFWSFLLISLIIYSIMLLLSLVIIIVPVIFLRESADESTPVVAGKITLAVLLILLPVVIAVADYSRAWQVTSSRKNAFIAIGNGFKYAFRSFFSGYFNLAVVMIMQVLLSLLAFSIISGWKPGSGGGIFLMFLVSQSFFIIRILFRTWRYGTATSLFDKQTGDRSPA